MPLGSADGSGLTKLLDFSGTIDDLKYGPDGRLAMLATENANKEVGATEAGTPISGDLDQATPEQRIAVLEQGALHFASPPDMFVYEYDWRPGGAGFVGTAAPGDGDDNWWSAKLYAFSAADGVAKVLYGPTDIRQQIAAPRVSRDGATVAFIAGIMSDFGSTGGDVYTLPLSGGPATNITPAMHANANAPQATIENEVCASSQGFTLILLTAGSLGESATAKNSKVEATGAVNAPINERR